MRLTDFTSEIANQAAHARFGWRARKDSTARVGLAGREF
jgi:hypothetical protein